MIAQRAAEVVLLVHLAFILFVALGGFLVLRWRRLAWLHVPSAVWGALIELVGWVCPLTPLENRLRLAAGGSGYEGSFLDHYVTSLLYPAGLTRREQVALGLLVVAVNILAYALVAWRHHRARHPRP